MDDFQQSMLEVFTFETNAFLEDIEKILMECEQDDSEIIKYVPEIFRIMHTIKSSAAMMSYDNISKMAHAIEDLFFYIRENNPKQVDKASLIDIVLDCVDFIRRNMQPDAAEDPTEKMAYVKKMLEKIKNPSVAQEKKQPAQEPSGKERSAEDQTSVADCYRAHITFKPNCQMMALRAFEIENKLVKIAQKVIAMPPDDDPECEVKIQREGLVLEVFSDKSQGEIRQIIEKSPFVQSITDSQNAEETQKQTSEPEAEKKTPEKPDKDPQMYKERRSDHFSSGMINVAVSRLDHMVDLAGEMVIAEMGLRHAYDNNDQEGIDLQSVTLAKMILQMQEAALATRMVTLSETFHKLNRIVRDIVRKLDKDVEFIASGEDTEVDRAVVENILSPLMHIVRNAMDHGIEPEQERIAKGKAPQGRVELTASAEGRNVVITITDDGKGFDKEKILEKALASGIVTVQRAQEMTDEEINALIFLPGFSTNQEVTELSGRGVGMDVVNENMKKINGKVGAYSEKDKGTKIVLEIPLTMAIVDALIIKAGEQSCALPISGVKEIFESGTRDIRNVNGDDVVLVGENCYKIIRMDDFFGIPSNTTYQEGIMLLVNSNAGNFVIFADQVQEHRSIVVKPIPVIFGGIQGISGCTILGDGRINLILDLEEFGKLSTGGRRGAAI